MTPTAPTQTLRSRLTIVLAVAGLSTLTGALFLWALIALHAVSAADLPALVGFMLTNIAAAGLLWWVREFPVRVYLGVLAVFAASALITGTAGNGGLTLPLWFSVFALTAYAPLPRATACILVGWAACSVLKIGLTVRAGVVVTVPEAIVAVLVDVGFFFLACAALGLVTRFQAKRAREAEERTRILEDHARAVHAEAVATERNRLARDLHDVAAHELMDALLAVRVLHTDGNDPELSAIEERIARALSSTRTVVRTLRADDEASAPPAEDGRPLSQAVAAALSALSDSRGLDISGEITVESPVSAAASTTVLSVLRESVLNADRHAPGAPVSVTLSTDGGLLVLAVRNPIVRGRSASTIGTGYGLIGAAERARLVGGVFRADRIGDHWIAELRLPLTSDDTSKEPTS